MINTLDKALAQPKTITAIPLHWSRYNLFIACLLFVFIVFPNTSWAQSQSGNGFTIDLDKQDHRQAEYFSDPLLQILSDQKAPPQAFLAETSYRLRPGDILTLQLKSPDTWSGRGLPINSSGDIWIPEIGPIPVAGLTFSEAQYKITAAFRAQYKNPRVDITIDQIRPYDIYINIPRMSSARLTIPAGVRLSKILERSLQASGETNTNSRQTYLDLNGFNQSGINARHIIIRHADNAIDTVDFAPYLTQKDHSAENDPFLLADDKISLQRITKETSFTGISGAVSQPIELPHSHGDRLSELIEWAGGLLTEATTDSVRIIQTQNHSITWIPLSEADTYEISPNSRIVVPYQSTNRSLQAARIEVRGEVRYPGTYPITEGKTTIQEVMELAGGTTDDALPHAAYIQRSINDILTDPLTQGMDTVDPRMLKRASDQLREGFEYLELEAAMDQNRAFIDLQDQQKLHQTTLSNGDQLVIPRDYQTIFVFGQVNRPGYQPYKEGQSIEEYLSQADGLTIAADPERVFVIEAGTKAWIPHEEASIESGDMIFVDRVPFDAFNAQRNYEIQLKNLRRRNLQLILTSISTITAVITTYVALFR